MNTEVFIEGDGNLAPWFQRVERTLSRFDPDSPLSQLNRCQGRWVVVPPLLYRALEMALTAAAATGGAFDPTMLGALEAAGYGRSYELGPSPISHPVPGGRWAEVELASGVNAVRLPHGVRIDLGGIGKGLAVDGAMLRLRKQPRALVNAGGDLAIRTAPGDPPVLVDVDDPANPGCTLATFGLHRGAVATSSAMGRRWGAGLHHIIDPRSGSPANSGVMAATVVAGSAARAEVLAKACIVLGRDAGLQLLAREDCQGLLVTASGELIHTLGMEAYLHASA